MVAILHPKWLLLILKAASRALLQLPLIAINLSPLLIYYCHCHSQFDSNKASHYYYIYIYSNEWWRWRIRNAPTAVPSLLWLCNCIYRTRDMRIRINGQVKKRGTSPKRLPFNSSPYDPAFYLPENWICQNCTHKSDETSDAHSYYISCRVDDINNRRRGGTDAHSFSI